MSTKPNKYPQSPPPATTDRKPPAPDAEGQPPREIARETAKEIGGPKGPEPTRYGDWEVGGRCTDF